MLIRVTTFLFFSLLLGVSAQAQSENTQQSPAELPAPATTTAAEQTDSKKWLLRYQFERMTKLRYRSEESMTLRAEVGEQQRIDASRSRQVRCYTVQQSAPDGSARLAMQFEDVWMQKQIDDQEPVEFRSTMDPAKVPQIYRAVAHSLQGAAPTCNISPLGVSLTQDRIPKTGSAETADNDDNGTEEQSAASFLMPLPEQPVGLGESWKEEFTVPVRGSRELTLRITILRSFRLESVTDGVARISFRSSVNSPLRSPAIRSQLIQATPSGEFQLDLASGRMLSRTFRYSATVIGALGPESLLSSVGTKSESLLLPETGTLGN